MNGRVVVPVAVLAGIAMAAVGLGAAADRTPDVVRPDAGWGSGTVPTATPVTDDWAAVAGAGPELSSDSANACERGDPDCLARVVAEMEGRLAAQGCEHTAPFAFMYREMTQGVYDAVREPGFFAEPPVTVHADALFAQLYFDAFDNWAAGREEDVPPAWRVAFSAAERDEPSAATDLLLGMNAHIARDLPYVVADVAAWQAAAESDGSDFLRINDVIDRVRGPMLAGAAARFDPTLTLLDFPLPALVGTEDVDLIGQWRTQALERGVRLSQATTDAEREAIEAEIERESLTTAVLLLNAGASTASPLTTAERDAYCEAQRE